MKVKNKDIQRQYEVRTSIADRLPWLEWSDQENIVLLEDLKSCGALLEIQDISTEAKPEEMIEEVHKNVKGVFQSVVPLEDNDPWIVQIYIQDDLTLDPLYRRLEDYVKDKNDPLTKKYLEVMERHFKLLGREGGMFRDPLSDLNFRGRTRRIRLAVYRRYEDEKNSQKNKKNKKKFDVVNELKVVTETLITQLRQGGMNVRRLQGKHFYEWLVRWFNPKPIITEGDQDDLLKAYPYPSLLEKPHGWNFCQNVFFDTVKDEEGAWVFDGIKHKVMVFQDLQDQLDIGVISRERSFGSGKNRYALIDKFPPGTIYTIQLIFESKNAVEKHLNTIKKAAVGQELVIQEVKRNVERAFYELGNGNMLFRSSEALYIRAATHEELEENERNIRALMVSSGLTTVKTEEELYPLDVYLRFLPFNFSYKFDKKNSFRSTYKYADDIARLLPVYGRSKGDGMNPLFIAYNRGGEPFIFDPTSTDFKQSNSHMFIPGTTGAGKSVTLNSLILSLSAVSNPRIIAIEVGGSFDLSTKLLKAYGRGVRTLKFSRKEPIVLNPYAEAYKALELVEKEEALLAKLAIRDKEDYIEHKAKQLEEELKTLEKPLDAEDAKEDRDILTEMMLATRIMVTGGDDRENEKITRSDMMLIMQTLIHTMKRCRDAGVLQMLVQHVAESFNEIASKTQNPIEQSRLREFSRNLATYTLGMKAQFVNGVSEPLGEFDCLHVDFGFMQEESNRDLLNICCISLLSKVMAIAEANKASFRPTFLVFDEIHIFLSSEIGIVYLVLLAKVARKFGVWLIFATQNINDFSGKARKILSMIETWICLSLDREEVAHIETFKPLTEEMKALLLSVQKFPGLYSEGVLIGKRYSGLFRNVPPRFMLALSMTEQHERAELAQIMQDENLTSELEAVEIMAKRLEEKQAKEMSDDRTFLD